MFEWLIHCTRCIYDFISMLSNHSLSYQIVSITAKCCQALDFTNWHGQNRGQLYLTCTLTFADLLNENCNVSVHQFVYSSRFCFFNGRDKQNNLYHFIKQHNSQGNTFHFTRTELLLREKLQKQALADIGRTDTEKKKKKLEKYKKRSPTFPAPNKLRFKLAQKKN